MNYWISSLCAFLIIFSISDLASSELRKDYTGYQVLEVKTIRKESVAFLRNLQLTDDDLYFANRPVSGRPIQIMVSPERVSEVKNQLKGAGFVVSVHISDVQSILEPLYKGLEERKKAFDLNDFNPLSDIYTWLNTMTSSCRAGLTCSLTTLGNSHENRPVQIFRITKTGSGRRAVFVDGSILSSEWLSTSTAVNLLNALATGSSTEAIRLADTYDWHIIPVVNPDGYNYTHGGDRLWRKNRRPNGSCIGTNLNVNFDNNWGAEGVTHSPCNNLYCGISAASEAETRAVQAELRRLAPTLRATISLHGFGSDWTFPYGYSVNHQGAQCSYAIDHSNMLNLANIAADASQQSSGITWHRGSVCDTTGPVSGILVDFAKDSAGVHNTFAVNLRGDSFIAEKSEIGPAFLEVFSGIVALLDALQ